MKKLFVALALSSVALAVQPAYASHVFFSDVRLNGVALDSANGLTNPAFNLNVGDGILLTATISGDSDTLSYSFDNVTVANPTGSESSNGGTRNFSRLITFNTAGTFNNAGVSINLSDSSPDYFALSGGSFDSYRFGFTANVANGAVPEPSTWAMMIAGFGLVGGAMRRRKPQGRIRFA